MPIVSSPEQLQEFALSLSANVKPRGEGRTKEQVENWSVRSILLALSQSHHMMYPVTVTLEDKPDMHLRFVRDLVGVEITEAIPEDYARAIVIAKQKYPNAALDRSLFRWDSPRKTNAELHDILKNSNDKLIGPGWAGDSVEREWANGIKDTIISKLHKINKPGYSAFPNYWLAIYDNLRGPALDLKLGVKHLRSVLPSQDSFSRTFRYVFIEVGETMVAVSRGGQLRYFPFRLPEKGE